MASFTRPEAERLLAGLRARREDAIDAGDLDAINEIDDKIAKIEARLAAGPTGTRPAEPSGTPSKPKSDDNRTRNIIIAIVAVLAMCGVCGQLGDDEPSTSNVDAAVTTVPDVVTEAEEGETLDDRVAQARDAIDGFSTDGLRDSKLGIIGAVGMMNNAAAVVVEAEAADHEAAAALRRDLVAIQRREFPRLRDAIGPIFRGDLWEADITAKTTGSGFRTIQFTGGMFAANRNIKAAQTEIQEMLTLLRFKRAEYRWIPSASEFDYYSMDSPDDSDLVPSPGG